MDKLPLPIGLQTRVERKGHTRRLSGAGIPDVLAEANFIELRSWIAQPAGGTTAEAYLAQHREKLDAAPEARDVPEVRVLDSDTPVKFYRGRWTTPGSRTGAFVARRPRAYGNELWCYALLEGGKVRRIVDFTADERERPCDIAWRLQAAIDSCRHRPQVFSISVDGDNRALRLYSPVPQWAQRRWDILGEPVPGTFLEWSLGAGDVEDERAFARDVLWLEESEAVTPKVGEGH